MCIFPVTMDTTMINAVCKYHWCCISHCTLTCILISFHPGYCYSNNAVCKYQCCWIYHCTLTGILISCHHGYCLQCVSIKDFASRIARYPACLFLVTIETILVNTAVCKCFILTLHFNVHTYFLSPWILLWTMQWVSINDVTFNSHAYGIIILPIT